MEVKKSLKGVAQALGAEQLRRVVQRVPAPGKFFVRESAYFVASRAHGWPAWNLAPNAVAMYWHRDTPNFGDALAPFVMNWMTGFTPKWVRRSYPGKVLSVGSIITRARPGDVILGSGMISDHRMTLPPDVQVLALRGPLTAQRIGLDPEQCAYGDPGQLAAEAFCVRKEPGAQLIGLVPHFVDLERVRELAKTLDSVDVEIIDVRSSPRYVIERMSKCRAIVSTSLHGLIVGESLGIPSFWATVRGPIAGGDFKFNDYYLGSGRACQTAWELMEAVEYAASLDDSFPAFRPDSAGIKGAFDRLVGLQDAVS